MDYIFIEGLKLESIIGVYEHEKTKPQPLLLNLSLGFDANKLRDDRLEFGLDYDALSSAIQNFVSQTQVETLERMALNIIDFIFQKSSALDISCTLSKPQALKQARMVSVVIKRSRREFYQY